MASWFIVLILSIQFYICSAGEGDQIQEPASMLFSLLNLSAHIHGLSSFLNFVYYILPRGRKGPYYNFVGLWTVYGLLSVNACLWSVVFHTRNTPDTHSWNYSSAIAALGFSLILSIIRVFRIKTEPGMVMVAAPLIGFIATHICYLNFYTFDYGWNAKVCLIMGVIQLLIWISWAYAKGRLNIYTALGLMGLTGVLFEVYDPFPYKARFYDAHSIWHLVTASLTLFSWRFVRDDAASCTKHRVYNIKR